ncbi:hypothetical protein EDF67_102595 [Sphingobacterium sp. JUb78]|nr:hypothetical protein [Sphingobacterium kitahiroshimense]TCR13181.1 hypothetical protein EDF67_102595 [Sphingobacterium sp. JUb78]
MRIFLLLYFFHAKRHIGKFNNVPFNCARALPAVIVLRRTILVYISTFGGNRGNAL